MDTLIGPDVAFAGTVTVTEVEVDETIDAAVPLKVTESGALKFVPEIVTVVPGSPVTGVNEVIVGAGIDAIVKLVVLKTCVPFETDIGPVVALAGTATESEVWVKAEILAATPLKVTDSGAVKFVPVIVTMVPGNPNAGEKEAMVGPA